MYQNHARQQVVYHSHSQFVIGCVVMLQSVVDEPLADARGSDTITLVDKTPGPLIIFSNNNNPDSNPTGYRKIPQL
jgi:hypothetical protein